MRERLSGAPRALQLYISCHVILTSDDCDNMVIGNALFFLCLSLSHLCLFPFYGSICASTIVIALRIIEYVCLCAVLFANSMCSFCFHLHVDHMMNFTSDDHNIASRGLVVIVESPFGTDQRSILCACACCCMRSGYCTVFCVVVI